MSTAEQIANANPVTEPSVALTIPMEGPLNRQTGYGNHFVELIRGLLRLGHKVHTWPYFCEPPLPPEVLATLSAPFPHDAPVKIIMANPAQLRRTAPHTIGITVWETTQYPYRELTTPLHDSVDELIVPCKTNIDTFRAHLGDDIPIHYVPEGVDSEFWTYSERDYTELPIRIGLFGALTYRKGIDLAIEAFNEAFDGDPDIELHIGTTWHDLPQFHFPGAFGPTVFTRLFGRETREQVRDFYHSLHALFAPFRGEGFYLPGAEFMATGGNLISANSMGPNAYLTPENGWIIPHRWGPVLHWGDANHGPQAREYGEWIDYEIRDLVDTLRAFVDSPPSKKRTIGERASDTIPFYCNSDYQAQTIADIFLDAHVKARA